MHIVRTAIVFGAIAVTATGCSDLLGVNDRSAPTSDIAAAFATVPVGYSHTQNSFGSGAEGTGAWFPGGGFMGMMGSGLGASWGAGFTGGFGSMIGGTMHPDMLGGSGLGRDFGRGRHGDPTLANANCTFSASTGRLDCASLSTSGYTLPAGMPWPAGFAIPSFTITRSVAYSTAAGAVQSAFDSVTTNRINTRISVIGTFTRRDSTTSALTHASDRTVTGVAPGNTQHVVNGTSSGREVTSGSVRATREVADTTLALVVPKNDPTKSYPIAGSVIRTMRIVRTVDGATTTSTRREVITYDGSATARMSVTVDGVTKSCTMPLPFGKPVCP